MIVWNQLHEGYESMVEREMKRKEGIPQNQSISQFSDWEVEEAVKKLPEEYRLAIILVDVEELSYQEAARVMECSVSRFRSRVSRGRWMVQVVLRNPVPPRDRDGEKR
jgi:RNA polymerase sigma-70 factor (ECF subfamily)